MAGIFDALVRGARRVPKSLGAAKRLVAGIAKDEPKLEVADVDVAETLSPRRSPKTQIATFASDHTPSAARGIGRLGALGEDRDDDGARDKDEMPPPAKSLVTHDALRDMPEDGTPIIGSGLEPIGWVRGKGRGKATMGTMEDVGPEGESVTREVFFPQSQGKVSAAMPDPEPTADNRYRMSGAASEKIPESVAQARERTDKEQLEWGAKQHNLALQALQFDPEVQKASGLAPGQLGTIIRGARAGDDQAVDMLDILLGQGDTSNENVAELKALLRTPGLSAKDRKAIIAEVNKVQAPGREQSFRSELEAKRQMTRDAENEKKMAAAAAENEAKRSYATQSREDAQAFQDAARQQQVRSAMASDIVRMASQSPNQYTDEQLDALGKTVPPEVRDAVINQVRNNQAFMAAEHERKVGIGEWERALKQSQFDQSNDAVKARIAGQLYDRLVDAYKNSAKAGAPLSRARLEGLVDRIASGLNFPSVDAAVDEIMAAGASQPPSPTDQLKERLAAANLASVKGNATSEDRYAIYANDVNRDNVNAKMLQAYIAQFDDTDITPQDIGDVLVKAGGDYAAAISLLRQAYEEGQAHE